MRDLKPMILFVDDEELARRTFKRIAEKEFRVLLAESVDEAIQVLESEHEDIGVLLSDQRMPGRLGVDLLEHCRKHYPKIIRMLTTAYSELDDAIAAVNRGEIMRYIEKPWGNIDGLLIDLRVAMSLYEMRAENEQLVAEKLSTGYKTSRLDKIRTLVAIAACQGSKNSLRAVESLLRQIAEIEAYRELPALEDMQGYQVFGQPLNDSISAIEIGRYLTDQSKNAAMTVSWEDLVQGDADNGVEVSIDEGDLTSIQETLVRILLTAKTIFGGAGSIKANVSFDDEGCVATVIPVEGQVTVLTEWLTNRDVSESINVHVGALLQVFLLTFSVDGHVQLALNELGLIEKLEFHFYGNPASENDRTSVEYDWIDDLLILFS